jgi:hypothetical protein
LFVSTGQLIDLMHEEAYFANAEALTSALANAATRGGGGRRWSGWKLVAPDAAELSKKLKGRGVHDAPVPPNARETVLSGQT